MASCEGGTASPFRETRPGHYYKDSHISGSGKVHLGDVINFGRYPPELRGKGLGALIIKPGSENPLNSLPCAAQASFKSYDLQHDPTCLPDTRVDVLQEITSWVEGHDERSIFWLSGLAGTGKSTIARTIARKYYDQDRLGASFFFSKGRGDASHAGKFFTTIAVQLANKSPSLKRYICDAITDQSDIASQSLRDQWRQLVLRPLSKLDGHFHYPSLLLVVDALDECEGDNDVGIIIQILAEARSLKTVRLRILTTSRPEIPIRYGFHQIPDVEHQDFILHNIPTSIIDHDISIFLEHSFKLIRLERAFATDWPGKEAIRHLVQKSSGLFIWAATACRFIREGRRFAAKRLSMILGDMSNTAPENQLNEIYLTVLKNAVGYGYKDQEKENVYKILREVLGSIVVLFSPLSSDSLITLLHVPKDDVNQTLEDLHTILNIPKQQSSPIRLHHPSFRDFLLDKDRCGDQNFWVDEKQAHKALADNCMRLMFATLKRDIYGLHAPGSLATNVESSRLEECLPAEVQYACLYWVQHLQRSELFDNNLVHQFLREHLLHWLEALSLMKKTSEGVLALISLDSMVAVSDVQSIFYRIVTNMVR